MNKQINKVSKLLFKEMRPVMKKILFILILTSLSATTYAQTEMNSKEYDKLRNYIFENFTPKNVRKKGISVFTMVKYYIDPNGSTDSIIPSDNMVHELRQHVIDMDKETINWNLILPASQQERIALVPIFITPVDVRDSSIKVQNKNPAVYFGESGSFSGHAGSGKEYACFLPMLFLQYYSRSFPVDGIYKRSNKNTPGQPVNPVRKIPIDTLNLFK